MRLSQSLRIAFRESARPITQPQTKFGGSPVWIGPPQWPLSASTGRPMQFICQIALDPRIFPDAVARMAYVFMTHDPSVLRTWNPDEGENAVILQPGSISIAHAPLYTGPALETPSNDPVTSEFVWMQTEYATELSLQTEPPYVPPEQRRHWSDDELTRYVKALGGHKIGGSPVFAQDDDLPFEDWRLLLQLDGGRGTPFFVNFGDRGSAFAFSNADCTQARFLWQG